MEWQMSLKTVLLIGHIIGVAMGAGGATMSDTLFLTSVRDNYIDPSECKLLKVASKIVVLGLVILCFTGGAFFLVGDVPSERFWAKMTVVGIAVMNGFIMHRKLFPVFEKCSQEEIPLLSETFLAHLRLLVSAGTISALSWYAAVILGTWKSLPLSYVEIMAWYLGILGVILLGANIAISIFGFGLRSGHKLKQRVVDMGDGSSVEVEGVFEHAYSARQLAG